MAMAKDSSRTILVEIGAHGKFSDIDGRHLLRMDNSGEKRNGLVRRLQSAGCVPDTSGNHWLNAGNFSPPVVIDELDSQDPAAPGPASGADQIEQDGIAVSVQGIKGTGGGSFIARGRVLNNSASSKTVAVTTTYFDERDEILGTATGMVNTVAPGQTKTIELLSFDNLERYHSQSVQIDNVY